MKIAFLGAGTWGTALAFVLNNNGHQIKIWDHDSKLLHALQTTRKHPKLQNFTVPDKLHYVSTIDEAIEGVDLIIESVSSAGIRPVLTALKKLEKPLAPIIFTSKGIEQKTSLLFPEVALEVLGEKMREKIGCLSGPSHAEEVINKTPTTIVASAYDSALIPKILEAFQSELFRVYPNKDIHGVCFGGAMKNVIAIACSISDGLEFGDNTKAALLTRGLHEMRKLSRAKNCIPETLNGLSGLGDLFVTCVSTFSRNYQFGRLLAQGLSVEEAKKKIGMVVEGVYSCVSAKDLAKRESIPTPVIDAVYAVLYEGLSPRDVVISLLQREVKEEHL